MLSIITINYNNNLGLERTIASVQKQMTKLRFEHLIIDGASTDCSINTGKRYQLAATDVIFSSIKDKGIYNAMNRGIDMASGSHVAFLNSGDVLTDTAIIEKISSAIEQNKKLDFLYGDLYFSDENNSVSRKWVAGNYQKFKIYYGWMPPHPMTTIRKSIIQKTGYFDERLSISADYDLMLRILLQPKINIIYMPEFFVKMELGGVSNGSFLNIIKANIQVLKSWVKNSGILSPYWVFFTKPLMKIIQLKGILH